MRLSLAIVMCVSTQLLSGCVPQSPESPEAPRQERESGQTPMFSLLTPPINGDVWKQYRRDIESAHLLETPSLKALLSSRRTLNRVALEEDKQPQRPKTERALLEFQGHAWKYAKATTPEHYIQVGRSLGLAVIDALSERSASGLPLVPRPTQEDDTYASIVGTFARHAQTAGLLPLPSPGLNERCKLQAIFMKNWSQGIDHRVSTEDYERPMERICWLRWQVERHEAPSIEGQLEALAELSVQPDYPTHYNRGVLLLRAARRVESMQSFRRSTRAEAHEAMKQLNGPPAP